MSDFFKTIKSSAEGLYKEKMSKFISFAVPVSSSTEAKEIVKQYQKQYFDARHVCWAYMIGADRKEYLSNDNGEPSGTAGKPILGQINSFELTNIVIIVVRYFGGIKLGTSGLIVAYKEAAADALNNAEIIECHEQSEILFSFPYLSMNDVMKVIKGGGCNVLDQTFDNDCTMRVSINADDSTAFIAKISDIDGVKIVEQT